MVKGVCAALLACALTAACTVRETKTVVVPAGGAENACVGYGFTPGTTAYDNCVSREADARRRGRMQRDYAETALVSDSQAACASYGLSPGSASYQNCVRYEVDARRFR
ncbi:MAG TPA: hypothetical protein VJ890_14040 [Vineibacter sp.]|nr:hypothetical protein [Vineibacter sp.]